MKIFRKIFWITTLFFSLIIFACVTINIYFPAEKVESVAEEIVNEIRGGESDVKGNPSEMEKNSLLHKTFMALSVSIACADEVISVSNPTIRALKEKMKDRYSLMKPYYRKKMLNEKSDGYVSMGNTKGMGLKQKRHLKGLVKAENKDRKNLYKEIAGALKIAPGQVNKVGKIFAEKWQKTVE